MTYNLGAMSVFTEEDCGRAELERERERESDHERETSLSRCHSLERERERVADRCVCNQQMTRVIKAKQQACMSGSHVGAAVLERIRIVPCTGTVQLYRHSTEDSTE
jgi:hypothetical protein